MAFSDGEFVDSEILDMCETSSLVSFAQVVLENVFDQVPSDSKQVGHMFDCGDTAQIENVALEGLDVAPCPISKWDRLSQTSATASTFLVMPVKHDENTASAVRKRYKLPLKSPIQAKMMAACSTPTALPFLSFSLNVKVDRAVSKYSVGQEVTTKA